MMFDAMPDETDLAKQLIALRTARASGMRRAHFKSGDVERELEYKSDKEMSSAILELENRISAMQTGNNSRVLKVAPSKGL
ncbi:MAG: hypothetical protein EB015_21185 [Methylocystaceae bacterium]|nr:hypothetical protein [Methylocystaceae bacterium]